MSGGSHVRCARSLCALVLAVALTPARASASPASASPASDTGDATLSEQPADSRAGTPSDPREASAEQPADSRVGAPSEGPEPPPPSLEPPPPSLDPPDAAPPAPAVPAPESFEWGVPPPEPDPSPEELEGQLAAPRFPDPGVAPDDGMSMLVLSTTSIVLAGAGLGIGLGVGLRDEVPLSWLLPSTLIPAVGVLAFAGGGLYLGIDRRRSYRRWAAGYRVIGLPQGKGLRVGASFALLGALALIPSGALALNQGNPALGAPLLALGGVAAVATPTMFVVSAQRQRRYALTGGWRRPPLPPRPGEGEAHLELSPTLAPLRGGLGVGVAGRF